MNFFKSITTSLLRYVTSTFAFLFRSVNLIALAIIIVKVLEFNGGLHTTSSMSTFVMSFIGWFSILYGVLLPLILIKVWERLDNIDREFDREADAVKLVYNTLSYLPRGKSKYAIEIAASLREYVEHVINNYKDEVKSGQDQIKRVDYELVGNNFLKRIIWKFSFYFESFLDFDYKRLDPITIRMSGDRLLSKAQHQIKKMIVSDRYPSAESDPIVNEILMGLNNLTNIRADRISLASQRLFQSLRIIALITSIIFLVPFYFVSFTPTTPLLDNLLVTSVTLLVLFIYLVIEDFDEPFGGTWRITIDAWERVLDDMNNPERMKELILLRREKKKRKPIATSRKIE